MKLVQEHEEESESGTDDDSNEGHFSLLSPPIEVTKEQYYDWVMKAYKNTRGLELAGNCSHTLLMEFFHEQSSRWPAIARNHIVKLQTVSDFVDRALIEVVKDDHIRIELRRIVKRSL